MQSRSMIRRIIDPLCEVITLQYKYLTRNIYRKDI
jgi:hypothetical protein